MVLKLRLARVATPGGSKRHLPRYNIVLAQARTARDALPLEVLGTYNPIPSLPPDSAPNSRKTKDIKLDVSRAQYWLGVGAQPSDTVWRLLAMIGLLEPRWLASGEQKGAGLKGVRFATHERGRRGSAVEETATGVVKEVGGARKEGLDQRIRREAGEEFEVGIRPKVGATTPAGAVDRGGSAGVEGLANVKGQERDGGLDGESMMSR